MLHVLIAWVYGWFQLAAVTVLNLAGTLAAVWNGTARVIYRIVRQLHKVEHYANFACYPPLVSHLYHRRCA